MLEAKDFYGLVKRAIRHGWSVVGYRSFGCLLANRKSYPHGPAPKRIGVRYDGRIVTVD